MTYKPRAASCLQKSSSQLIIWAPRPITSRSGASCRSPNVSYSMSIPLACALGMRQSYDLPELGTLAVVARTLPTRAEVDERFTWDAQSVFPDAAAWEAAVETVLARLPDLAEFKGHLGDSPETLADWFDATERVQRLFGKATVYSTMSYSVDVGDQAAVARTDRTRTAAAQLGAAMSFAMPEMIAIGFPKRREC